MPYTPQILTSADEWEAVRSYLGVDPNPNSDDFSDDRIKALSMLGEAEDFVLRMLSDQLAINSTFPTWSQIQSATAPAVATDLDRVKRAVIYYIANLFAPGETNAVNVSNTYTLSKLTNVADRGGLGDQWVAQKKFAEGECLRALELITNWQKYRKII